MTMYSTYPTVHVQYPPYGWPVTLSMIMCISLMSSLLVLCDGRHWARIIQKDDDTLQTWTVCTNCLSWYDVTACMFFQIQHTKCLSALCSRNRLTSLSSMFGISLMSHDQSVKVYRIFGDKDCSSSNCDLVRDSEVRGSAVSVTFGESPAVLTPRQWHTAFTLTVFGSAVSMLNWRQ